MNSLQHNLATDSFTALSTGTIILSVIGTLGLVILLIVVLGWSVRRGGLLRGITDGTGTISLVASKSLGARERVVVVDIGTERLVLGVTATNISCLTTQLRQETINETPSTTFPEILEKLHQKYRSGGRKK
ncbi:flagellar biosynthetic protein FliO [Citrobacter sp. wls619]|uniref:flagellar biosynthetic protein FliO n=1 Tax=Citrobacter sp. wls619 TaxID=2576432 RepID=UPI0010CA0D63|nr:flagellar biosynthetic protein FliO [Citrobacter sp. wls619]TKV07859.1 flagellar biosynthetic protein FliO [Citrobacter sp. wls619]